MTSRVAPDWKVSVAHRILVRVGFAIILVAIYFAAAAAVLDAIGVWWIVAGLALGVLVLGSVLPEPVPRDYMIGHRSMVDTRKPVEQFDRAA